MTEQDDISGMGIYKLTNLVNGKIYIGASVNLKRRMDSHKNSKKKFPIGCAVRKYGWENFSQEIVEHFNEDQSIGFIFEREIYWITFYNATDKKIGYNLSKGGECSRYGCKHSEETKLKISKANKGRKYSPEIIAKRLGRPCSEETKRKMSEGQKRRPKPTEPKPKEQREKISVSLVRYFKSRTKERIEIDRQKSASSSTTKRRVHQIDMETGEIVKTWPSFSEAARVLWKNKCYQLYISQCVNHPEKFKSAKGFKWILAN